VALVNEALDKRLLITALEQLKEKYELYLSGGDVREALTRATLIDPLLAALGWDVSDPTRCIVEDWVQRPESPDWADYSLLNPDGATRVVWEAKRADHPFALRNIGHPDGVWSNTTTRRFVEQGLDYAYRKGADWVVLTNGHQLVLLESFRRGQEHLRPNQARLVFSSFDEMLEHTDELWLLNRASVLSGRLDDQFELEPRQIVVSEPLPRELTAPDIYAERPDWMNVPLADIPDRESELVVDEPELVYTNLLPVLDLPEYTFGAPTGCRYKRDVLRLAGGLEYIPCILREGRLWTFADLSQTEYVNLGVCTAEIEPITTSVWEQDKDKRLWLTALLHDCLHEHARNRGLEAGRRYRYYFRPFGNRVFRRVRYRSFSNRVQRWVVRQDCTTGYWVHSAADLHFVTLGGRYYLLVDPSYVITEDGAEGVDGSVAGPMVTSLVSGERNRKYLYDMNFWKAWLAGEIDSHQAFIHLSCGDARVSVSTQFVSGTAPFSVPPFRAEEEDLDEEVLDG
jgi:hypothetical protein